MESTNGTTCGSPISMQDVRDRVSKPQFNGGRKRGVDSVGGEVAEMKWQTVWCLFVWVLSCVGGGMIVLGKGVDRLRVMA